MAEESKAAKEAESAIKSALEAVGFKGDAVSEALKLRETNNTVQGAADSIIKQQKIIAEISQGSSDLQRVAKLITEAKDTTTLVDMLETATKGSTDPAKAATEALEKLLSEASLIGGEGKPANIAEWIEGLSAEGTKLDEIKSTIGKTSTEMIEATNNKAASKLEAAVKKINGALPENLQLTEEAVASAAKRVASKAFKPTGIVQNIQHFFMTEPGREKLAERVTKGAEAAGEANKFAFKDVASVRSGAALAAVLLAGYMMTRSGKKDESHVERLESGRGAEAATGRA